MDQKANRIFRRSLAASAIQARFRKTRASKAKAVAVKRNTNTAVMRKLNKPKFVPKTKTGVNTSAITTLSKQVRQLQMKHYGDPAYQRQSLQFLTNNSGSGNGPTLNTPIAFAFNSFYDQTPMYVGSVTAGVPGYAIAVDDTNTAIRWKKSLPQGLTPVNADYDWAARNNDNEVSQREYMPSSEKLRIRFKAPMWSQTDPIYYNVKIIKVKNRAVNNTRQQYSLPATLGGYYGLANKQLENKRYLSKKFHTVLVDKWVKLMPRPNAVASNSSDTPIMNRGLMPVTQRDIFINYQFKGKPLKPYLDTVTPDIPQQLSGDSFWVYTAEDEVLWCIISSSLPDWINPIGSHVGTTASTAQGHEIEMVRSLQWRDPDNTWGGA